MTKRWWRLGILAAVAILLLLYISMELLLHGNNQSADRSVTFLPNSVLRRTKGNDLPEDKFIEVFHTLAAHKDKSSHVGKPAKRTSHTIENFKGSVGNTGSKQQGWGNSKGEKDVSMAKRTDLKTPIDKRTKSKGKPELYNSDVGSKSRQTPDVQHQWSSSKTKQSPREVHQVVFAKVHKAASSTVQNILLRFALSRKLNVLLPVDPGRSIFSEQKSFKLVRREDVIRHPPGAYFDIFCSHVLYHEEVIARYFPDSATRVAILREPLEQTLSALKFYSRGWPSPPLQAGLRRYPQDPVNGFLAHPEHFEFPHGYWGTAGSYTNNRMSVDLGFPLKDFEQSKRNRTKIDEFVQRVDKEFDLVLISDYFDESMVLLRRQLGWQVKDILYLKINVANQKKSYDSIWNKEPSNSTALDTFRKWNAIDYALYEHFLRLFFQKIKNEPDFEDELLFFTVVQEKVRDFCIKPGKQLEFPASAWSSKFTVRRSDCRLMSTSERELAQTVRVKQLERLRADFGIET